MADDKIIISIELDDGSIQKGFLKIEKDSEKAGSTIGKNLEKATTGFSVGKLVAAGAAIVGAFKLAQGAVSFFNKSIKKCNEQEL